MNRFGGVSLMPSDLTMPRLVLPRLIECEHCGAIKRSSCRGLPVVGVERNNHYHKVRIKNTQPRRLSFWARSSTGSSNRRPHGWIVAGTNGQNMIPCCFEPKALNRGPVKNHKGRRKSPPRRACNDCLHIVENGGFHYSVEEKE